MARAAGVVGAATLASRVLGLLRDFAFASLLGAGTAMDVFAIAFMIPNLFRRLVGEGALTVAFVPIFTGWLQRSHEDAHKVFNATWTLTALVVLVLTVLGVVLAGSLVDFFAPGFALIEGKRDLCILLLRICFPYIIFMSLVAVAMGALNAQGHFFAPAIAPVILNLCLIVAAVLAGGGSVRDTLVWLGIAVGVSGVLQVIIQIPALRARGLVPRIRIEPGHPAIRRLLVVMGPAIVGASVYQINLLVVRALASFEGEGAIAYLYYADRLLEFPLGVFVFAISSASLPALSRAVKRGDAEALRHSFASSILLALALALPSTAGLIQLREGIFGAVFNWNPEVFGRESVAGCASALLFYALGLVPITISRLYVQLCMAHENTRTPALATGLAVVVNAAAALMLTGPLPPGSFPEWIRLPQSQLVVADLGHAGLALATSIAALSHAGFLMSWSHLHYERALTASHAVRALKLLAATATMVGVLLVLAWGLPIPARGSLTGVAVLFVHVGLGAGVYWGALRVLQAPEAGAMRALLLRRRTSRSSVVV